MRVRSGIKNSDALRFDTGCVNSSVANKFTYAV
jgi:hypothetical protein